MSDCKVIALCNQKGGVGKTTTCVNLGIGLAQHGKRVLLIDLDAQASMTLSLGYKTPDELTETVAEVMQMVIEDKPVPEGYGILRHPEGVDLLPSNIVLANIEVRLFNTLSRETVLKNYLQNVKQNYDYILIDCMPSLGMLTANALTAANNVIIPAQPHYLSAKGLEMLLHSISSIQKHVNPNLKISGILLTMVDRRTNFTKDIIEILRKGYSSTIRVFNTEIPLSIKAIETTAEGKSIYEHDRSGKVSTAYENFTKEVIVDGNEQERRKGRSETVR
ncbi:MAG TPA: chromosome partitioning protein ParA [Clostridiales bacterium]|nr:chromosome partitioning protein ParA [Clostridiales bacterium]